MTATTDASERLTIGILAERTGTTTPTIRYYEEVGLLPLAARQAGGQRRYGPADVKRLQLIRRCREFGFPIEQVRELVSLVEDDTRCCTDARTIAHTHLEQVRAKLSELRALERDIAAFVQQCDESCLGGPGPSCVPLTQLAERAASKPATVASRDRRRVRV